MYCPSCGKQIPDASAFCLHCGKSTNLPAPSSAVSPSTVVEWEYRDFTITWRQGESGWVAADSYPEPAARLYYWQNIQSYVMPELQKLLDEGWQPVTEIGPACIQLRHYKSLEGANWIGIGIGIIASWGLLLLLLPFMGSWKFQMIGFHVQLRRPKVMSQTIV
jgi:hypothetical protein